jgi:TonB family protein
MMHEFSLMASAGLLRYLAHSAVMMAVIGVVAWLSDRLLRRVGPQAQHRMWIASFFAGVVLPLLPAGVLTGFGAADAGFADGTVTVTYRTIAAAAERWTFSPRVWSALVGLYLLTVLFCVTRLLWRWWRTAEMARRSAVLPLGAADRRLVDEATRRFGIAGPEVRCSRETRGPVMVGVRRPLLLAPEGFFAAGDAVDIAAALAHECAHIARRDFAKNLLYEVVAAFVAYHPACWLIRQRIAETRELVCDELAASVMGNRPEYAASLLRLATAMAKAPMRVSQAIGVFDGNTLEERIMRLTMDLPKVSRAQRTAMVALTACALLGGAATAAALMPQDSAAAGDATQEKVYKIGGDVSAPTLTHSVDAVYPESERSKGKAHVIVVSSLVVSTKGTPEDIRVVRSGGKAFDESAMEAIRQYRFSPAMRKGKPVAVSVSIETNMSLH